MKIDVEGMEEIRDKVRSSAYMIDELSRESEIYPKILPHLMDLFSFVKEVVSGEGKWSLRDNDDSFD